MAKKKVTKKSSGKKNLRTREVAEKFLGMKGTGEARAATLAGEYGVKDARIKMALKTALGTIEFGKHFKIKSRNTFTATPAQLVDLLNEKGTYAAVAKELGVSAITVADYIKRWTEEGLIKHPWVLVKGK